MSKDRINRLTYIRDDEPRKRVDRGSRRRSLFECECGTREVKDHSSVMTNHSIECSKCSFKNMKTNVTHNLGKHPLYRKWADMKNRCYNKNVDRYPIYGGRGIKVCDNWNKDFKAFHDFCISKGWTKGMSLERIDVNGDYEPNNCTIIPLSEQHYNKQNTFYVEHDGVKYCLVKLLKEQGKRNKYSHIHRCLKEGIRDFQYFIPIYNITFPEQ